jgi:hypothetical protein
VTADDGKPFFARTSDGVGWWWRAGECAVCERSGLPVTWLGPSLDDDGSRHVHVHVHACASCLDRSNPRAPSHASLLIEWTSRPPAPEPTPEPWSPLTATVLSCLSALCAIAALLLAPV